MTAQQTFEIYRPLAPVMHTHLRRRAALHGARDFKTLVGRIRRTATNDTLSALPCGRRNRCR
ncbi:MAG: hypothetical protein BGP20_07480 [Thiobacillus sp. 63-78]|nr:MAG: hypothetical protein BGP20_07480 [Thiobacillus sp. 63-78]